MKIFGREPALWIQLISSALMMFSAFVLPLTVDQQGVINAIFVSLFGLITAVSVHDGISAAVLGFIKAAIALGLAFGLHLVPEQQAIIMSFAAAIVGMYVRTQVTAPVSVSSYTPQ